MGVTTPVWASRADSPPIFFNSNGFMNAGELRRWLVDRETAIPDNEEVDVDIYIMGRRITCGAKLLRADIIQGRMSLVGGFVGEDEKE